MSDPSLRGQPPLQSVPGFAGPSSSSFLEPAPDLTRSVELVQRYKSGDLAALNELIERYQERVYRIARIRMGKRLRNLMESGDIVQNTFLVAFRKIGQLELRDNASIIQYLSAVLENQIRGAVDYFSAQKRDHSKQVPLSFDTEEGTEGGVEPEAKQPQPLDQISTEELKAIYDNCVHSLKPEHREVIVLREYAEAGWSEVAARLDRNEHAVQELFRRAQIKLAACVGTRVRP